MSYKICKVYNILDQMLTRCRGSLEIQKLNNSFKNANSCIELLQKIGDQNKLVGILMCFKYFKSIMNKYLKISSKKKKLESLIDLNKLNEKLETLSKKIEFLEKSFPFNNNLKNSIFMNNSINTNFNNLNEVGVAEGVGVLGGAELTFNKINNNDYIMDNYLNYKIQSITDDSIKSNSNSNSISKSFNSTSINSLNTFGSIKSFKTNINNKIKNFTVPSIHSIQADHTPSSINNSNFDL